MEEERPCCYTECCDPETSWNEYGMRIKWTEPPVPGNSQVHMLDPLHLKLCLECKKPVPLRDVSVWAWTHVFHQANPEGIYKEIRLDYDQESRKWDDWGVTTYEFSSMIYPTHTDEYRLTFNVKFRKIMIWANLFQIDHILEVILARPISMWTMSASFSQITPNIYIGNALAVMLAEEHGFEAILNVHTETDSKMGQNSLLIQTFKTANVDFGAGHQIPAQRIKEIVNWLRDANKNYQKILLGGREGQGRVGSIMTAYIFANNRNLTFEEAYNFVKSRRFVYCHKGLKDTLYSMYPRD